MFGYGDRDAANVVVHNACPNGTAMCYHNTTHHTLTEGIGYTLYGIYHLVAIIVLVNALIALMSNTLSRVQVQYSTQIFAFLYICTFPFCCHY